MDIETDTPRDYTNSKITAALGDGTWLFEISRDGFKFNREQFPDATANVFAKAFVDILEKDYVVTMEQRKKEEVNYKYLILGNRPRGGGLC